VPTDRLEDAAAQAEQEAARARAAARRQRREAAELAERLGTDRSPAGQRLAHITAALDQAAWQLGEAAAAEGRAKALREKTTEMYGANRKDLANAHDLRARAAGRWAGATLRRKGLREQADAVFKRVNERTDQIGQIREEEVRERAEARDLRQQARDSYGRSGLGPTYAPLEEQIAQCRAELPQLAERLAAGDRRDHQRLLGQADEHEAAAQKHERRAAALRAEKTLRERMARAQQARESVERAQAAREAAARRAAEQARLAEQRRREAQERPYQPPSRDRGGPSLGR
jgi:hypothetical protein